MNIKKQKESTHEKVVGILGGMGPAATVDLMRRIVANTPANDDIDHIRCMVDNNPKVPSRRKYLLGTDGENPGPCMADMAKRLERCGADFIAIPCNSAHYFYNYVAEAIDIPVIHLIDLVVDRVISENKKLKSIGLMGSNTVVKTGLYAHRFAEKGVQVIYPDAAVQECLFQVVTKVKGGECGTLVRDSFRKICSHLANKGALLAIIGCTELGVIAEELPLSCIDAAELLALEIVAVAKNQKAPHTGNYIS